MIPGGWLFGTNYIIHYSCPNMKSFYGEQARDYEHILKESDLVFEVQLLPVYDHKGREIEHVRAVHRTDTDDLLGVVGRRYQPIQNAEGFRPLSNWLRTGQAEVVRAGHFDRGRICVIVARNTEPPPLYSATALPAELYQYTVLVNSFDGSYQLSAYLALIVDDTVLPIPSGSALHHGLAAQAIAVRHVRSFPLRLGISASIPMIDPGLMSAVLGLQRTRLDEQRLRWLALELLIPEARRTPERLKLFEERTLSELKATIELHPSCIAIPSLKRTLLGFLLGFCYWIDVVRSARIKDDARRAFSLLLGSGMELKMRALTLCLNASK